MEDAAFTLFFVKALGPKKVSGDALKDHFFMHWGQSLTLTFVALFLSLFMKQNIYS